MLAEKDTKAAAQRRKVAFTRIVEQLQAERYSHFFESRVTKSIAPMYNVAVRRPTCLRDITKAIKSGAISTNTELMRDVALLCANAIQFNGDEGEDSVGYCAKLLWERFERCVSFRRPLLRYALTDSFRWQVDGRDTRNGVHSGRGVGGPRSLQSLPRRNVARFFGLAYRVALESDSRSFKEKRSGPS